MRLLGESGLRTDNCSQCVCRRVCSFRFLSGPIYFVYWAGPRSQLAGCMYVWMDVWMDVCMYVPSLSPVIGRHKKCCLVIGYNVSNIVTNQICIHGRFQYTRKAFKWHHRNCGAGIKTINQTFGPMGVLARYRNICQLRHLGRAKCKHIPDE